MFGGKFELHVCSIYSQNFL